MPLKEAASCSSSSPVCTSTLQEKFPWEISPAADPASRTYKVRVSLPQPPQGMQLGMTANVSIKGTVQLDGMDIYDKSMDTTLLRKRVGMVFQQPNPFPMSIYDNIAYGPRVHGIKNHHELDEIVENSLRGAAIWDEVKDRLKKSALGLSGGQQQRICIARALAVEPEVILMDEPTSALDPISTAKIEELMEQLKKKYTVVVVTHNMQQAVRISDYTAFFLVGEMVEYEKTKTIFSYPQDKRTEEYITGRFG